MPKILWFIALAAISLVGAGFSIYQKRDTCKTSTLLVFYLATASSTWIAEFIVLGLFNSYEYRPGVFTDLWAQNLLGHLILNTTVYPSAAVIMAAFSLKYKWMAFIGMLFTLIEYLFIKLGIYAHNWWRYYMTYIAAVIFMLVARKWFEKINKMPYGLTRTITFYFVAMILIHTPAPILLLLQKQYYKIAFVDNLTSNRYLASIIIIFSYHLILSFVLVLLTCVFKGGYWRVVPLFIPLVVQTTLARMGILIMQNGWKLSYTWLYYDIAIALFILIEKYTLIPESNYLNAE